jgi:FkbM family methyltransferase
MMSKIKSAFKAAFAKSPRRLQHAYFGAFPDIAPGGFSRLIEVERLRQLFAFLDVDCVLDIGANEGQYALQLRSMVGYKGRLVSFEPIPSAAANLRQLSETDAHWSIEEIAVSDRDGHVDFHIMTSSQLSSISAPSTKDTELLKEINRPVETIRVRCERLENIFERIEDASGMKRPFLKMDTQGHDLIIARGAQSILPRFVGIQTELAIKRLYETSATIGDSLTFFQKSGFELSSLVPNNQGHFPLLLETDGLFIREDLARGA